MVVEEALQDVRNILQEIARILCSRPYCRLSIAEYSSMAPMMTGTNPSFSQLRFKEEKQWHSTLPLALDLEIILGNHLLHEVQKKLNVTGNKAWL